MEKKFQQNPALSGADHEDQQKHSEVKDLSDKNNPQQSIEEELSVFEEASWKKFTRCLRGFFSVTTQLLIATLAVCLGLFLSCLWPTPILPTWVFETLIGIAIVGTGVSILSYPLVIYSDYKDWRTVKVNYDPDSQKGLKKNGEFAAYNDSFFDYLSYYVAQIEPTTTFGNICFWTAFGCTFVLTLFSLTYFLGEVPSIHFLAPGFDAMYHFLIVGFGPLLRLVGEPASLVTPLFAHIIGTIFVTSLPFITLELGRRIRGTPPELRGRVVLGADEPAKTHAEITEAHKRDEIQGFSGDTANEFFKKVEELTKSKSTSPASNSDPAPVSK